MKTLLINSFKKFSKRNFAETSINKITFKEFFFNTLNIIQHFKDKGLKENDRILIKLDNSLNYLEILLACFLGGFIACPIDPTTKKRRINELKKIYNIKYFIKEKIKFKKKEVNKSIINYNDTNCLLIGSSGTTGESKGIVFSSSSIVKSAKSFAQLAGYNTKSRILHCLPMFYMGGILDTFFASIINGSTIIINPRFSIMNLNNFWELPIKNKANILFLTPSIISMICYMYKKPKVKLLNHLKKYKMIVATGSTLHQEIRDKFFKIFKKKISVCYGATELGGPVALQIGRNCFKSNGGKHSNDIKIKIISKKRKKLIFIKTPFLMKGYLTRKGFEKVQLFNNGYYNTGDIGTYQKGILKIEGRERDIIKRGGELLHLSFIENIALKMKFIRDVAAFGKKDLNAGEELFLAITLKKNKNKKNIIKKIFNFLSTHLRPIEIPKKIFLIQKLPRTSSGKVLKNKLQLLD